MEKIIAFLMLICFYQKSDAQLFKFTFDGSSINPTQGNAVSIQNGTVTQFTRSAASSGASAINWATGDEVFNSSGWNLSTQGEQYLFITITANPGFVVRIQSIGLSTWSTYTGPSNGKISVIKGTTEIASSVFMPGKAASSGAAAPSSLPAFFYDLLSSSIASDKGGSLTIKVYGWGNASGGNLRLDNFFVNGSVLPEGPLSYDYINNRVGVDVSTTLGEKLEVNGNIKANGIIIPTNAGVGKVLTSDLSGNATWQSSANFTSPWLINGANISYSTGRVGIGTVNINDPAYKLFVETGIRTRKIKVDQAVWPDYVFDENYKLPSLQDVKHFINKYKHLQGVASVDEVKHNGLDLGENQAVLLQKIEELTLYIIDQDKRLNIQDEKIIKQNTIQEDLLIQLYDLKKQMLELKKAKPTQH